MNLGYLNLLLQSFRQPEFIWLWPFTSRPNDVGKFLRRINPCFEQDKGVKVCLGRSGLKRLGDAVSLNRIHSMHVRLVSLHIMF